MFKILKVTYTYTLLFTFSCWKKKLGIPEQQNKGLFAHLCVPTFRLYVKVEKSFFVQFPSEKHFAGLFYTALCMLASSVQHFISISQCMTLLISCILHSASLLCTALYYSYSVHDTTNLLHTAHCLSPLYSTLLVFLSA